MDFLAGAAVIIVLLYILGFGLNLIASGIGVCLMAVTLLCELFFIFCLVRLFMSKKVRGVYKRIGRKERGRFDTAFYEVDGRELPNIFPCEMAMRDKFYKKDKEITLRLGAGGKCVYDLNAVLSIVIGAFLFGLGCLFWTVIFEKFFG
ncbi:MAG: hypothetical protein K5876_01800 [Ruminiclostridium sp.]|nr:hypothetical protein [Ruminiclostridium sp.]